MRNPQLNVSGKKPIHKIRLPIHFGIVSMHWNNHMTTCFQAAKAKQSYASQFVVIFRNEFMVKLLIENAST